MEDLMGDLLETIGIEARDDPQTLLKRAWAKAVTEIRASMPPEYLQALEQMDRDQEAARKAGERYPQQSPLQHFITTLMILGSNKSSIPLKMPDSVCLFLTTPLPEGVGVSTMECHACFYPVPLLWYVREHPMRYEYHFQECPVCGNKMQ